MDDKTVALFQDTLKSFAPAPDIKVSQWAEENRVLSKESSSAPGKWRNDTAPYQIEIMDAVNDPEIEDIVVMSCSQIGKNEIINNIIGYYVDIDPCPILLIEPTLELAEDYSKRRLAPLIRDTKALAEKISDAKSRDSNNTILSKSFPGGLLVLVGANSPRGLASKPIQVVIADEIDGFPASAGKEGDPLALSEKRTITFSNRKKIKVSTPTIKGASRIEEEYLKGTREKWKKECPHCGAFVYINIQGVKYQYEKDEHGNYTVWDITFQCPCCFESFNEYTWGNQPGAWIADNPLAKGTRSFHLNAFVSPWWTWEEIIINYLQSKHDADLYKVFTNTVLGISFEDKGEIETEDILLKRRETYEADIPHGVLILTCGVDVQGDRLEYEIVGWGKGEESWGILRGFILSDPELDVTWNKLDEVLERQFSFSNDLSRHIACTFIDSGGHSTSAVYKYCKKKQSQGKFIFAIKGMGGPGYPLVYKVTRTKPDSSKNKKKAKTVNRDKENCVLIILGVDSGKSKIMSSLKIKDKGDGYCHFPDNDDKGYDQVYFKGLISEKIVYIKQKGRTVPQWQKINENARNEPLDMRNYAYAALKLLNVDFNLLEAKHNETLNVQINKPKKTATGTKKRKAGCVKKGIDI